MTEHIYLDNAATTALLPAAGKAMQEAFFTQYANPGAVHEAGTAAADLVEGARRVMARLLSCRADELIFTSGGSEADNLALLGTAGSGRRNKLVVSAIEHPAVLETARELKQRGFTLVEVPVESDGRVNEELLLSAIDEDTFLVSIIHANNEIGTLQPIRRMARKVKRAAPHVLFHTDAVQSFGHVDVSVQGGDIDLLSLSAHKFHGPKGVGALFGRKGTPLKSMIFGGDQEGGRRAGTTNVPGVVGMAMAAEVACRELNSTGEYLAQLTSLFRNSLVEEIPDVLFNGHPKECLPGLVSISIPGVKSQNLMLFMEAEGVIVSSGAACKSTSTRQSHVLKAINRSADTGTIRISASKFTTADEMHQTRTAIVNVVRRLRK
jgi:cysteine desulfurase